MIELNDYWKLMCQPSFTDPLTPRAHAAVELYHYEIFTVADIVYRASAGKLDIPAFQRGFVWTDAQLLDLAESLWRDYPIGMLLLWAPQLGASLHTTLLVADGQHRIISLCALFGQKPHWCEADKSGALAPSSIWFDPVAQEPPRFFLGDDVQRAFAVRRHLVFLPRLFSLDIDTAEGRAALREMAKKVASGPTATASADYIYGRLVQARGIADRQVIAAVVSHPRDDVMEIFTRLSGHGIRFRRLLLRTVLKATRALWDTAVR